MVNPKQDRQDLNSMYLFIRDEMLRDGDYSLGLDTCNLVCDGHAGKVGVCTWLICVQ